MEFGIPDSTKEKIFKPFFATKPTGQGNRIGIKFGLWYCKGARWGHNFSYLKKIKDRNLLFPFQYSLPPPHDGYFSTQKMATKGK